MASQERKNNKHPVLKMPLDLSSAVDSEVYEIIEGFKSGVEAKNFLCSAILYYSRSPLVLSANAILDSLDRVNLEGRFGEVLARLNDLNRKIDSGSFLSSDTVSSSQTASTVATSVPSSLDSATLSSLSSLRKKFKI